ncbi:hypothetical protein PMG71_09370 [Roseofilum sp. BLCC_M154]|uniref:Antitoxin n=1 Tax=Roseofilum acuticapitatum BLCC-M154 TaxID=3022444 RepID=A0ABT7ARU9_9CYAN|nr:hypothetical protein [Roseofilum acuticapitatum]MDJ1169634.1 hypothetical protein [Roseofilum acuticapitatum BLCC-M154]
MSTVYRLKASEINPEFLDKIKTEFGEKEIEIVVSEIPADDTEYLLQSEANKQRLLRAIANIKANQNLITVSLEDIESPMVVLSSP